VNGVILVTGAAGFAGSHVVEALAGRGDIVAWRHESAPPSEAERLARWEQIDLLDADEVNAAIARIRPSAIYHCAGAPNVAHSWRDTITPLSVNVLATHYLLDAVRRTGTPCRMVVPGSATVYTPSHAALNEDSPIGPANPYAVSKLAQETLAIRAVSEDGIDVVVARPFNHTGPRQRASFAAPNMARQIAQIEHGLIEPVIRIGNLDAQRDITDVRDIARAYIALMDRGATSTVYNVASGVARTMRSVLDALVQRAKVSVTVETDPALIRPNDTPVLLGDASRLRHTTGWRPEIPFEQTLDDLLDYWRSATAA
jgi:GDP-4-dehydro-6-deoxy-D-mannose reductase